MKKIFLLLLALTVQSQAATYTGDKKAYDWTVLGTSYEKTLDKSFSITTQIYRVETKYRIVFKPYEVLVCNETDAGGNGNWYGFFEAAKKDKPQALALAILGVGETRKYKLVKYFDGRPKPSSWTSFTDRIREAETDMPGIFHDVIMVYGKENSKNLGYYSKTCKTEVRHEKAIEEYQEKTPEKMVTRDFKIRTLNLKLIKGEKQTLRFWYDGFEYGLETTGPNKLYLEQKSETANTFEVEIKSERLKVSPQNEAFLSLKNDKGKLLIEITDSAYDAIYAEDLGEAVVSIYVYEDRKFWPDKKVGELEIAVGKNVKADFITSIAVTAGKKMYAKYWLQRRNSILFAPQWSPALQTSKAVP